MKATAAILWEQPGKWEVEEFELSKPRPTEVLVEMVATGLCHSDDHMVTGDIPVAHLPYCGGHEGSGVVREVGADVRGLQEGDHVITSFVPSCGRCKWCALGKQNLCDLGRFMLEGTQLDGTFRMKARGRDVAKGGLLGTFATWQVYDQLSLVKIRDDAPLEVACLVACGVPTGWGSATNGAAVKNGDVVIVMGAGGIGMNAVQGAAFQGARKVIVADPQPFIRDMAMKLGATDAFEHIDEAADYARSITHGQGADAAIVTVGVVEGEHIGQALNAVAKSGTVVATAQGPVDVLNVPISLMDLSMMQKRIQGVLYGMHSPQEVVPRLIDL